MELKQHMGLHQQLVMTPRLQMALKILQVSTLELEQFLKQELLQNPLLESPDEDEESEEESTESSSEDSESGDSETPSEEDRTAESATDSESESEEPQETKEDEIDWDDYLDDIYAHAYGQNLEREDDERFERVPGAVATFEDGLKSQLHVECSDDRIIGIAEFIIDELNAEGFVEDSLEEIAATLKVSLADVERALAFVQSLDPPGIGARSLEESLLLQLDRRGSGESLAARVVRESFAELKACQ